jgi:kynurenine 3-monooxygenase
LNGRGKEIEVKFDLMIGADGAHSTVRYNLMKFARMSYHQEYIDTLWCEFQIPPKETPAGPEFAIHPNRLHIWPGHDFMFIAIPSLDKTFTSTLFLPADIFAELDSQAPEKLVNFFQKHFPGVVPDLISEDDLKSQYRCNPHLPLISIKCAPYHSGSSAVILGDAAHAMVPFYGQGMNAGLEDVRVLFDILDQKVPSLGRLESKESVKEDLAKALDEYTNFRAPDAFAINDLALRNYQEMRSDVVSPVYQLRKSIEEWISVYFPRTGWATQYSRVSFGNWRYSEVTQAAARQKRVLLGVMGTVFGLTAVTGVVLVGKSNLGRTATSALLGVAYGLGSEIRRRFGPGR